MSTKSAERKPLEDSDAEGDDFDITDADFSYFDTATPVARTAPVNTDLAEMDHDRQNKDGVLNQFPVLLESCPESQVPETKKAHHELDQETLKEQDDSKSPPAKQSSNDLFSGYINGDSALSQRIAKPVSIPTSYSRIPVANEFDSKYGKGGKYYVSTPESLDQNTSSEEEEQDEEEEEEEEDGMDVDVAQDTVAGAPIQITNEAVYRKLFDRYEAEASSESTNIEHEEIPSPFLNALTDVWLDQIMTSKFSGMRWKTDDYTSFPLHHLYSLNWILPEESSMIVDCLRALLDEEAQQMCLEDFVSGTMIDRTNELEPCRKKPKIIPRKNERPIPSRIQDSKSPMVVVRRGRTLKDSNKVYLQTYEMLPTVIPYWYKLSLSPISKPKDLVILSILPIGENLNNSMTRFLEDLDSVYLGSNLGELSYDSPFITYQAGPQTRTKDLISVMHQHLETVLALPEKHIVLFVAITSYDLADLLHIMNGFYDLRSRCREAEGFKGTLTLQLVPISSIADSRSMKNLTMPELLRIALELYNRCPDQADFLKPGRCPIPAFILARPSIMDRPPKFNTSLDPSPSVLDEGSIMHVAYSITVDKIWLCATWSDSNGHLFQSKMYYMGTDDVLAQGPGSVFVDIWRNTMALISTLKVHWRIVVSKIATMWVDELEGKPKIHLGLRSLLIVVAWENMSKRERETSKQSFSLIIICVDVSPKIMVIPPKIHNQKKELAELAEKCKKLQLEVERETNKQVVTPGSTPAAATATLSTETPSRWKSPPTVPEESDTRTNIYALISSWQHLLLSEDGENCLLPKRSVYLFKQPPSEIAAPSSILVHTLTDQEDLDLGDLLDDLRRLAVLAHANGNSACQGLLPRHLAAVYMVKSAMEKVGKLTTKR